MRKIERFSSRRKLALRFSPLIGVIWLLGSLGTRHTALAQGIECVDRSVCGEVSPLIPTQSAEAVHVGLVWKKDSQNPKILFHSRFPEYTPNDMADPALIDMAIGLGAFSTPGNQFNSSLRNVLHGFDPFLGLGMDRSADDSFQRLTYGGYLMRQGLSQSVPTRITAVRTMERLLLFDINQPDAFKNSGKFHTALLDEADFAMNRAAFAENGYSKGAFYNFYCSGRTTLADGRVYVFGGHDMQSSNGLYKVNIFDPDTEEWVRRTEPCTRANWQSDRFGLQLFAANPDAPFYANCDPRNQQSTQPSDPSDNKYARWYPSPVPLPNNTVLVLAGSNQDNSIAPDPNRVAKGKLNQSQSDTAFSASRVNQVVPEVYDPKTDRNIALENARMAFPNYPQVEVVQTGPGKDDWKVCTMNGEPDYGEEVVPGGTRFGTGLSGAGRFTRGRTWCLDVLGALRDPNRGIPAKNHWQELDEADEVRVRCCPTASLLEIDAAGHTVSHKWVMVAGQSPTGDPTATIEVIDFADPSPRWKKAGELLTPLDNSKAVVLPDGKVFIAEGSSPDAPTFEQREGLRFQMFDPDTGTTTGLARTTVSRGSHGSAILLPDGSVFMAGENREQLIRADDPSYPLETSYAGVLLSGDPDQSVPNGQIFWPPYLFKQDGSRAARPVVATAPTKISYGGHFDITVAGDPSQIGSVVILRTDANTHSLSTGDRYVKMAFHQKGASEKRELRVRAPKVPAQAVPGIYMLFVTDKNGVPSMGRRLDLGA
jgi:hypothetical protein